ncbi:class I SAM-dependent methyltransferase [Leptolyngbya sp. FACHB-16]|uniref:class I SAM-dependent methyltransferase n=1 Tax=unclassified Leptolyngbya TaxID=2650499 RepID=UPI00168A03D9|nr:class I SAM-dependent methyltransferase [Leptolyngbya sp. FACHB-16]MBD2153411.1 methyltransferase domain-containing protein [Leptolyngbya sp. FACHB-16]
MYKAPQPKFLQSFWNDAFNLEHHLAEFLQLDPQTLSQQLDERRYAVADVSHHFDWELVADFYEHQVGSAYLFELAAWHLTSRDYIGSTLALIADQAKGHVLDFGGGIGTHAIAAALCPDVEQVTYVDINPINRAFVQTRIRDLGLEKKLHCLSELDLTQSFDTILCFDVIEHLSNPSHQLLEFHKVLQLEGCVILNWCFFKGYNNEYPTHMDDPVVVNTFFQTLQHNFLEVYHPHLITTRCYRKVIHSSL